MYSFLDIPSICCAMLTSKELHNQRNAEWQQLETFAFSFKRAWPTRESLVKARAVASAAKKLFPKLRHLIIDAPASFTLDAVFAGHLRDFFNFSQLHTFQLGCKVIDIREWTALFLTPALDLPDDLWSAVYSFLDIPSICCALRTCKFLHRRQNAKWRQLQTFAFSFKRTWPTRESLLQARAVGPTPDKLFPNVRHLIIDAPASFTLDAVFAARLRDFFNFSQLQTFQLGCKVIDIREWTTLFFTPPRPAAADGDATDHQDKKQKLDAPAAAGAAGTSGGATPISDQRFLSQLHLE